MPEQKTRLRQPVVVVLGHVDSGKCVSGDTLLELADGRILPARNVYSSFRTGKPTRRPDGVVYESSPLTLLSVTDGGAVVPRRVSHIWKLTADKLVEVRTKAGYNLKTTPEHKFLVLTPEGEARYVEAGRLKLGEFLMVPSRIWTIPWPLSRLKASLLEKLSDGFLVQADGELKRVFASYSKSYGVNRLGTELGDISFGFHLEKGYLRATAFRELAKRSGLDLDRAYDHVLAVKFTSRKRRASHRSFWVTLPKTIEEFQAAYYLIGLLYGDGIRGSGYLATPSDELAREYEKMMRIAFGVSVKAVWRRTCYIVQHGGGKTLSRILAEAFDYPLVDKNRRISVPHLVAAAPDELTVFFLRGFFDAEGYVEARNNVGVACESWKLMQRLPTLLQRYGCMAYFSKKDQRELIISGRRNLKAFFDNISFRERRKAEALPALLMRSNTDRVFDLTPFKGDFVRDSRKLSEVHGSRDFQPNYLGARPRLSSQAVMHLISPAPTHGFAQIQQILSAYRLVQVTGLREIEGECEVYDFTVEETHNFLANGLVVHNTSLLDGLRGTAVQAREVGGITQEIGASFFPMETLEQICGPLLDRAGGELQIPGLLMIDTPGHAVFSNLRLRGGSAADIAIVVVDVLKGLENQTLESIDILKLRKVPFLVALNKIDMIKGWRKGSQGQLQQVMKAQPPEWSDELEERLYNVVGGLSRLGFQSDAYYRVKDFRQQVTVVPTSARNKTGIPELLAVLIGLSQQFLKGKLRVAEEGGGARGIILEMQEEVGIGETANIILTEGRLRVGDSIGLVRKEGAFKSKVKALFMPKPLDEMRDPRDKFTPVDSVYAAAGVKLVSPDLSGVVVGTSVASFKNDAQFRLLKTEMEKELSHVVVKTDNMGVIVKAGSVGGLEALLRMLDERGVPVRQADIGDISKNDIVDAQVVGERDPYLAAILGFDSKVLPEAKEFVGTTPVFVSGIIYEVIDSYVNWAAAKREADEKAALSGMTRPCKMKVIPGAFFRRNDPAVFGVEVVGGRLKPKVRLMSGDGRELGIVEQIQDKGKALAEVGQGDKVAISVDGPTLGRQVKENDIIYSLPRSHEARLLRTKYLGSLTEDELKALEEIIKIKSATDPLFGF